LEDFGVSLNQNDPNVIYSAVRNFYYQTSGLGRFFNIELPSNLNMEDFVLKTDNIE
jgi:hypothetical protein